MQQVERYSKQRHFGEIWDYTEKNQLDEAYRVALVPSSNQPQYLPRRVPQPTYAVVEADGFASGGHFRYDASRL